MKKRATSRRADSPPRCILYSNGSTTQAMLLVRRTSILTADVLPVERARRAAAPRSPVLRRAAARARRCRVAQDPQRERLHPRGTQARLLADDLLALRDVV